MRIVKPEVRKCGKEITAVDMIFCPDCMVTTPRTAGGIVNFCPSCGAKFKYSVEVEKDERN